VTSLIQDRIDLKFYKLWKAPEKLLKDASSRQNFSTQVVAFIEDSYENELVHVDLLSVRVCSSQSSDSNQGTAEHIFIEFDINEFHQHLPAYSKVCVVYPTI